MLRLNRSGWTPNRIVFTSWGPRSAGGIRTGSSGETGPAGDAGNWGSGVSEDVAAAVTVAIGTRLYRFPVSAVNATVTSVTTRSATKAQATEERPGHRERLIAAMAESIEEKGYRNTLVADVVRIARTSRRTYYEHFRDRDACFLAVFDDANAGAIARIAAAVRPESPWEEQVDAALRAYLDVIVARPRLWQSFARELPALGREGAARQRAAMARFAELLVGLVESGRRAQPELYTNALTLDMALIIVGGLRELVISAAEQGRDMRELRPTAAQTIKGILRATVLNEPE